MAVNDEAKAFINKVAQDCVTGFGTMSITIYDTAWISMISKPTNENRLWLFPDSFAFIVEQQNPNGGWESYASDVDGILNTLASLLALCYHDRLRYKNCAVPDDVAIRIHRAVTWLQTALQDFNVENCDHVGFELLIPSLLGLLEKENIRLSFPEYGLLLEKNCKKMAKFDPTRSLYGSVQTTLLHSLEGLIGVIDFDRVKHQTRNGSMLFSPSSTAAYLIHSSTWDEQAESYLQDVYQNGQGHGCGGFPSAYPSTQFEISWVRILCSGPRYKLIFEGTFYASKSWVFYR